MARNKLLLRQITPEPFFYVCFAWFLYWIKLSPLYQNISKKSIIFVLKNWCIFYNSIFSIRGRRPQMYIVIFTTYHHIRRPFPEQIDWAVNNSRTPRSFSCCSGLAKCGFVVFIICSFFDCKNRRFFNNIFFTEQYEKV